MARSECIQVDPFNPDSINNRVLVQAFGKATNCNLISDNDFGARIENAYRLVRTVEMYQWYEIEGKNVNEHGKEVTTQKYSQGWFQH